MERRGRDSNPGRGIPSTVFKTAALNRSATSPNKTSLVATPGIITLFYSKNKQVFYTTIILKKIFCYYIYIYKI
jgi:hypothetical protein